MRALVVLALVAATASADPLPPGSLGIVPVGVASGTGADAKKIGAAYTFGFQAAWQPMNTDRRLGWAVRWGTFFGRYYGGSAARIDSVLRTVQMDFTAGLRFRPWDTPASYVTLRGGAEFFRMNEPIPPSMQRAFVGGITEVGYEHFGGWYLLDVDVRYGLLGSEPSNVALLIGISLVGP
jgi:hypothetical protein